MKRKDFLSLSTLTVAGLASFNILSCKEDSTQKKTKDNSEELNNDFELNEISINELQDKFKSGKYTSEQVTKLYLDRIEEINKKGPAINAVIEINPDAISIARSMDEEMKSGKSRGLLHGIPVLIKDNIDTADKMMTTAGSLALTGHIAAKDAFIVQQLREAGAVLLGKTNLSEWANFRSTRSVSGWSSRGGQTKNPYLLDRSPCGSSSGSAVAVSANLCVVAVGTETDGSIACPASMNGVVGIKPTVGLVSRSGIIPISKTMDTAGAFGRTVKDASLLLSVLQGNDPDDRITSESIGKTKPDYSSFLNVDGLKGKRIGIEKTFLRKNEHVDVLLHEALETLKNKGATIVEVEFMNKYNDVSAEELKVLEYEFKDGLNKYLASANVNVKSLKDVIDFNSKNSATVMPYFRQEIMDSSEAKTSLENKEYIQSLSKMLGTVRNNIDELLNKNQLDALCGPATGTAWCIDTINGDFWTGYGAYGPAAVAGYPAVTVPMGNVNELPVGITFFGKAYDEAKLISIGFGYEQASKKRMVPEFKRTMA